MNFDTYNALPVKEQEEFHVGRTCPNCETPLVGMKGHSTGALHTVCPSCRNCPDCDDGE